MWVEKRHLQTANILSNKSPNTKSACNGEHKRSKMKENITCDEQLYQKVGFIFLKPAFVFPFR